MYIPILKIIMLIVVHLCPPPLQSDLPGNHLLPASLGKVPEWFHDSPFRYNLRLAVGFLPGALLVSIVAGKL